MPWRYSSQAHLCSSCSVAFDEQFLGLKAKAEGKPLAIMLRLKLSQAGRGSVQSAWLPSPRGL